MKLRPPRRDDYIQWSGLRAASREFLVPWEPAWSNSHLTRWAYRQLVLTARDAVQEDRYYPLLAFRREDDRLLGGITIDHVRRGANESATLGYWMGEQYAGRGYMTDILDTTVALAFGPLKLSRLEAACVPENEPSRALLVRGGFKREGTAVALMEINGRWRDHELYARLAEHRVDSSCGGEFDSG